MNVYNTCRPTILLSIVRTLVEHRSYLSSKRCHYQNIGHLIYYSVCVSSRHIKWPQKWSSDICMYIRDFSLAILAEYWYQLFIKQMYWLESGRLKNSGAHGNIGSTKNCWYKVCCALYVKTSHLSQCRVPPASSDQILTALIPSKCDRIQYKQRLFNKHMFHIARIRFLNQKYKQDKCLTL